MNRESERDREPRKAYHPPRLVEYGDVRKLTQTGGSGSSDFGGPGVTAIHPGHNGH